MAEATSRFATGQAGRVRIWSLTYSHNGMYCGVHGTRRDDFRCFQRRS